MSHLKEILGFAWHYLRRYWVRAACGVLLGVVFGMTNASFIWAARVLAERLTPEPEQRQAAPGESEAVADLGVREAVKQVEENVRDRMDPWLPRLGREPDWRQYLGGLLFLPVLVAVRGAAGYGSSYCMGWVSERVVNDLRIDVLGKLSSLSLDFFDRFRTGDLLTRINTDTATLQRAMRVGFADLVKESITIVSILAVLLFMDWKLTLFTMVFLPLCLGPLLVLGKRARKASKRSISASVFQASQLVELFTSVRIIKAFTMEADQLERFRRLSRELVRQGMKGIKAKEMVNPIIEIISTMAVGVLIVYLFATGRAIEHLVSFVTGLIMFYSPVKRMGAIHIMMEQASVGVQRLTSILKEQPTVREPVKPKRLAGFSEAIRFSGVTFSYGEEPVLKGLDLVIPQGLRLGVAGPSGSGKSTLVNLLFRFYDPGQGSLSIDGVNLRDVPTHDLRSLMALVSQETMLFDMTVAENIACGRPGAAREAIEHAARQAFAHDFIMRLPNGYDTSIGERGITLSGGQRQRIAIARAFVKDAPILVLDEATAALDAEAEGIVQAAIDRLAEKRTVIAVAHRLATLAGMDEVIVLIDGRIVERGTFQELLSSGGLFSEMARRQGITPAPARS